jgi:hypothetical protein
VDLVELHLQGKPAHWNVVGHNFRDLHLQLDKVVDDAREAADSIAERMRALATWPDGRSDTVSATTTLPSFPEGEQSVSAVVDLVTARLRATVDTLRTQPPQPRRTPHRPHLRSHLHDHHHRVESTQSGLKIVKLRAVASRDSVRIPTTPRRSAPSTNGRNTVSPPLRFSSTRRESCM